MTAQNLKKSLLNYAISGKLSANWRKENPNSRISTDLNSKIPADFNPPFEIPNSWAWVKLGDLGEYKKGPFGSSLTKSMFVPKSENSIKVYEQKNAIQKNFKLGDYFITKEYFLEKMQGFIVKPNDIIISCAGTIGEVYRIPKEAPQGIINQALMRVRLNDLTIFEWFIVAFNFVITANSHQAKGTAIKNIPPFYILKSLYIPLPPLEEQEFIVSELEKLMSLAHSYEVEFQKLENCKKELRNLKKSLLNYAISGKLSANWRKENPNSRISSDLNSKIPTDFKPAFEIPGSWQWVKLGDICEIILGQSPNSNEIINLNSSQNYLEFHQGKIYFTDKIISKSNQAVKIANKTAQENSILLCVRAPVGIVNITDRKLAIGRGLCSIKPKKDNLFFIFFALQSLKSIFDDKATGTTFKAVTGQIVKNFYIPLPPLEEQERIVKKLDELFEILEVIENSL